MITKPRIPAAASGQRQSARSALLTAVIVPCILLASGCSFVTPLPPADSIDVGNGVGANLGPVKIRNAVMVTAEPNYVSTVSFIFTAINEGDEDAIVQFGFDSEFGYQTEDVVVPAKSEVTRGFHPGEKQMILTDLDTRAGGVLPVYVLAGEASDSLPVMVLTGDFEQYADLLPSSDYDELEIAD